MSLADPTHPFRLPVAALLATAVLAGCGSGDRGPTDGLGPASPGRLTVTIAGLPGATGAAVVVSGPNGFTTAVGATSQLSGLFPGAYLVTAATVSLGGTIWEPIAASQSVTLPNGGTAEVVVGHVATTGVMAVTLTGLPPGVPAAVLITGPGGFSSLITSSTTLTGLVPGAYSLVASPVSVAEDQWAVAVPVQEVQVAASAEPVPVTVGYSLATGRLQVRLGGVPAGASPSVVVSGPGGFSQALGQDTMLAGLVPGNYTVTSSGVQSGGYAWAPAPAVQEIQVAASPVPAAAAVLWSPVSGSLNLLVAGLPNGQGAGILVSGPGGFQRLVTGTELLPGLAPGSYLITANPVAAGGLVWTPTPASQTVIVAAGSTTAAGVAWTIQPGALAVTIAGLPNGTPAAVNVSGPDGYAALLTSTQTLAGLAPGSYLIAATQVSGSGDTWLPLPASQVVVVGSGSFAATVSYAVTTGAISVAIAGLPGGVAAAVTLSGPGGAQHQLVASQLIAGLAIGGWTVSAASVANAGTTYLPAPASQGVTVPGGGTVNASVTYAPAAAATLNLRIDGAYLTQAVQRLDHGVELVAGRDAYLRVFAVANEANAAQPRVRVRLFHGSTLVQTSLLNAPASAVPQAVNEGSLTSSWNLLVSGALVQPTLRVLVEVDPDGSVIEADEADNQFPVDGTPRAITVRALLPFAIRLVPVLQSVNGLLGEATAPTAEGYLADLRAMLPIGGYDVDVRAAYTTNAAELQSGNGNGAWGTVLSEVLALRNAVDQSSRYYYGVVRTTYSSGVAGMGYVGSPGSSYKAAIGWDRLGSRAGVLAHELGHNFGRSHAPCGGPAGPDPAYPHVGGQIGAWGLHVATLAPRAPTTWFDLMGYCNNDWVSDYTWNAVVAFRAASPTGAPPSAPAAGSEDDGLLLWGRVSAAGVILEPAFRVAPTGQPLPSTGAWRVEGRDQAGALVFVQRFEPVEVADLPGGREQHFAFVLPLGRARLDQVVALRVVGPAGMAERQAGAIVPAPSGDPVFRTATPGRRRLTWDATRHPMALVRDAVSGEVLSFARGGAILLWTGAATIDVQLSDGVRVVRRRVAVQ